ncbi:hypothetical protein ACH5RR_008858 [Cinchona calisaya]|uniref:EamA domain-containing protein n=1 Tax=Cinchona calisaya TaxID=153742 RepID=A0ABD3ACN7_9GENT
MTILRFGTLQTPPKSPKAKLLWILRCWELFLGFVLIVDVSSDLVSYWLLAAILPLAVVHTLGNLFNNMSLGKIGVSFTHTIKAMEPFFSVALSAMFLGEMPTVWVVSSLVPIMGGVALASMTEASFNWAGFWSAMASNLTDQSQNVLSKKFMVKKEESLDNITLFSIITIMSFVLLAPFAIFMEGGKFTPSFLQSAELNVQQIYTRSLLAAQCFHAYHQAICHEAFTYMEGHKRFVQIDHNDLFPYLLVNIGSGVSMIKVDGDGKFQRVSGTNVGGGTYWGLGRLLTKCKSFDELLELSQRGDNRTIDMLVGDIYGGMHYSKIGLSASTIASSFCKAISENKELEDYRPEDISLSLLRMISYNIGQISYLNALCFGLKRIFFWWIFHKGPCLYYGHNLICCAILVTEDICRIRKELDMKY